MLSCKDIAQRASDYLHPSLPMHKKLQWRAHLAVCENCRRFVRQFEVTLTYLQKLGPGLEATVTPRASEAEVNTIMEQIASQRGRPQTE